MGRNALHTQEEVFAAADGIAARGEVVSIAGLRAALGGGSNTTIYRHLAAWEDARREGAKAAAIEQPEAVRAAFAGVWQTLTAEVGRQIAEVRVQSDARVRAAEGRRDELLASLEQVEADLTAEAAARDGLEAELRRVLEVENTRKAADAATIEQMRQRIEVLTQERDAAQAAALKGREDSARLDGVAQALREQIATLQKGGGNNGQKVKT